MSRVECKLENPLFSLISIRFSSCEVRRLSRRYILFFFFFFFFFQPIKCRNRYLYELIRTQSSEELETHKPKKITFLKWEPRLSDHTFYLVFISFVGNIYTANLPASVALSLALVSFSPQIPLNTKLRVDERHCFMLMCFVISGYTRGVIQRYALDRAETQQNTKVVYIWVRSRWLAVLAKFFFACLWTMKSQKSWRTSPISSHLDRTSLFNKWFITWLWEIFLAWHPSG